MGRRITSIVGAVALALLWSGPAGADEAPAPHATAPDHGQPESFEELVRAGVEAHAAGDYDRAITLFQRAYALKADPRLVFNIARAHDRAGRTDEAIAQYQRYLDLPGTETELRQRATEALERLGGAPPPEPSAPAPAPTPATRPETPQPPQPTTREESAPYASILGWSAVGLGLATLTVTAVLDGTVLANAIDDFDAARQSGAPDAADRKSDAETIQRALVATYVVGGTLTVIGAATLTVAFLRADDPPAAALGCDAHGCAAVLRGVF